MTFRLPISSSFPNVLPGQGTVAVSSAGVRAHSTFSTISALHWAPGKRRNKSRANGKKEHLMDSPRKGRYVVQKGIQKKLS